MSNAQNDIQLIPTEEIEEGGQTQEFIQISQQDITNILSLAIEPSYISEITRKLRKGGFTFHEKDIPWSELTWSKALRAVSNAISVATNQERATKEKIDLKGEVVGSPKKSLILNQDLDEIEEPFEEESQIWNKYALVQTEVGEDFDRDRADEGIFDFVDESIDKETKIVMIEQLSEIGNEIAKTSEKIMQDVMERQFREYKNKGGGEYTDPGIDFYVEDEFEREWGLAIEVSVRYVNPIGKPYMNMKKQKAFEDDYDLLIMAPRFRDNIEGQYERIGERHLKPEGGDEIVHLHQVPFGDPQIYDIFMEKKFDKEDAQKGNPVIIPDNKKVRERLRDSNHISESYPVIDKDFDEFRELLEDVYRDFRLITESRYRNQLREAIEPVLGNFLSPYKIEQFLINNYWDRELNQRETGELVDVTGGTISTWMNDEHWDIITRGTGKKGTGTPLTKKTKELWKMMYLGEEPFEKLSRQGTEFKEEDDDNLGFSGYRIQAEYNRHPYWDEEDWEKWADKTKEERKEIASEWNYYGDDMSYTIMMGPESRLIPSYSFILKTLKDMGVDIRTPNEAPRGSYQAYPNKGALNYMINRNQQTIVRTK